MFRLLSFVFSYLTASFFGFRVWICIYSTYSSLSPLLSPADTRELINPRNPPASQHFVSIVKNSGLAWRDGALGLAKLHNRRT
jgi:hypothetical protein